MIAKCNPEYGNLYKYIPSELLTEEQKRSKNIAVKDEEYRLKAMRGEDVSTLLKEKADKEGYNNNSD